MFSKFRVRKILGTLLLGVTLSVTSSMSIATHAQGALGNDLVNSVDAVVTAKSGTVQLPWDATPDPDGKTIYFTSFGTDGSGVFSVPAAGGNVTPIAIGAPFVMPLGLTSSADGKLLYVADPWSAGADGDGIFVLPTSGGKPTLVPGTAGTSPRGVVVVSENGADQLYFTGLSPTDGQPAVMKILATGSTSVTTVLKGSPLVDPSGIVLTKDGTIYLVDRLAAGNGLGVVFQIKGGGATKVVDKVLTGAQYAGLTLTLDETVLMVSSLDPAKKTAQVILVNLATRQTGIVNKTVGDNTGAGGVHRASKTNIFAWAGSTIGSPGAGLVYRIELK